MSLLEALVLGILQGATEFLPVSSSGHLVLAQALLDLRLPGVVFEALVHVATLVSVCVVYRRELGELVLGSLRGESEPLRYAGVLAVGTLPAVAAGLGLGGPIRGLFESPAAVAVALLVTGGVLWTTRWTAARAVGGRIGWGTAVVVGAAQAGALVPGISRSGMTVAAALALGIRPRKAAEYSFLLAIPAIAGAAVLELPALAREGTALGPSALALGFVAAAVTGVAAIGGFLAMLRRSAFHHFAHYCWAVGAGFLAWLWLSAG